MPTGQRTTGGRVLRLLFGSAGIHPVAGASTDSQIARALCEAQLPAGPGAEPRSLDEIAAMAQWNSVGGPTG